MFIKLISTYFHYLLNIFVPLWPLIFLQNGKAKSQGSMTYSPCFYAAGKDIQEGQTYSTDCRTRESSDESRILSSENHTCIIFWCRNAVPSRARLPGGGYNWNNDVTFVGNHTNRHEVLSQKFYIVSLFTFPQSTLHYHRKPKLQTAFFLSPKA